MTRFLDVAAVSRLVQVIGIETVLADMAAYIADDYRRWSEFEKSPRLAAHSPVGVIELMPASDQTLYGFKYVNGHPQNTALHLPTVMAFGLLAEMHTGLPLLLSEMTLTTALRTAATSALVAKYLARHEAKKMAVIGCGAQSEFQILAFHALLGIRDYAVFDIDPAAVEKLRHNLTGYDMKITPAASKQEAVTDADIVTIITADKSRAAIITPDMVRAGMHINAVGGDCPGKTEIHPDILRTARVVVEYEPQTRIEGDIQQMPADFPVTEFWEIITGRAQGRQNPEQVTIFDSVGFALEDFSALRYLNDCATQREAGVRIELVPTLPNPKDLFGLLNRVAMPLMPQVKATVNVSQQQDK